MIQYIFYQLLRGSFLFILWYMVLLGFIGAARMIYALFTVSGRVSGKRSMKYMRPGSAANAVPISLLTPVCNEEAAIIDTIKSMLNQNYSNYEIIVINDGSTDNTLNTIIDSFSMRKITYPFRERLATKKVRAIYYNQYIPRLKVIDKENGGRSDALNAGLNLSRFPWFLSIGADSLLGENALQRLSAVFVEHKYTAAAWGTVRVANGSAFEDGKLTGTGISRNIWALLQTIEYFRLFLVGRSGRNSLNYRLFYPGSFGAFQKEPVLAAGGFSAGMAGEETDLVIKLQRYMRSKKFKYRMCFVPDSICWIRAPESPGKIGMQRFRWQAGLKDVLARNRDMFLNPGCGVFGMLALPLYFLFELASPLIEFLGYILVPLAWLFGVVSPDALAVFCMVIVFFGMINSAGALLAEELTGSKYISAKDTLLLGVLCIVENLFYRQMTMFFRLMGLLGSRRKPRAL